MNPLIATLLSGGRASPAVLGSLLVATVGSQQANQIQNELALGNITLDDVYNLITNLAASPAVTALKDTPSGQVLAPDEAQIEAERKFNEELNRKIFLPPEISMDQILSTPQTTTVPEPLITPDVPEQKVSVDDVGMTSAPAPRLEDMIMTILEPPENPSDEEKEIQERLKSKMFKEETILDFVKGNPNIDYRQEAIDKGGYIGDAVGGKFWAKYPANPFPGGETTYKNRVLTYMKPEDFLKLAEKKDFNSIESKTAFRLYENTNTGLSVPFLNGNLNEKGQIEIDGHEGRHRAEYVRRIDPDTPIPVYITVSSPSGQENFVNQQTYNYGRSLTEAGDILLNADFINEEGNPVDVKILGYDIEGKKSGEIFQKDDITSTNEKTDTVRQGEGQTTIEALKTKSLQGENVDQGSSGSSRENVLKTEEGFEVANKALGIDFFTKVLTKEIAPPKKKYEPILDVSDIGNTFDVFQEKRTGDFENHIFTSIPTFQEAQVATADALIKTLPQNGSILDLGGTEGGFINTITEERPDVSGFIVDPNVVAQKMFNEQQMPNAYYIREAFTTDSSQFGKYAFDVEDENEIPIETNYFDFSIVDDNSLDAVTEKMTFQFIDKGRNNKIKLISEKLKPEGIALFEEKFFTSKDDPVWQANEAKKNEFKLNYYDQKDLTEKQKNILEGMDKHQVTSPEFEEILSKYFNNVVQYWDSGNFKGYVASDSADTITKFLNNLEDLNSEYSNVSTPKFVTDKIVEKRRGGPISLPQMNML